MRSRGSTPDSSSRTLLLCIVVVSSSLSRSHLIRDSSASAASASSLRRSSRRRHRHLRHVDHLAVQEGQARGLQELRAPQPDERPLRRAQLPPRRVLLRRRDQHVQALPVGARPQPRRQVRPEHGQPRGRQLRRAQQRRHHRLHGAVRARDREGAGRQVPAPGLRHGASVCLSVCLSGS